MHSRFPLNARTTRRAFEGALLRVGDGFGCLHPWPELGDLPLEAHLEALRAGSPTNLGRRALDCAAVDGAARREGRWLFENLEVPESHVLAGSVDEETLARFKAVKLKCGAEVAFEIARVRDLAAAVPDAVLRLDFNGCLDAEGYARFIKALPDALLARIDFIEDPVPYDAEVWRALPCSVPLAVDRGSEAATDGFTFRVLKPAVQVTEGISGPAVITSSMDHPLGQVFAAYEAAIFKGDLHAAGLLTHWCFEKEEFGERLEVENARLCPPRGTGLGFDDLLEGLSWTRW